MNADLDKWGAPNLWEDVLALHQHSPLHACVGGGDQVYSVSPLMALQHALSIKNIEYRGQ